MKIILIFASFISLAVALSSDDIWKQYTSFLKESAEKCTREFGLSEDIVDRFLTERHSKDVKPMGCLKACILANSNIIIDDELSLKSIYELIDVTNGHQPEVAKKHREIGRKCIESTKHLTNVCVKALEFSNCCSDELDRVAK